jgi:predicted RNA binding protein YcfA (HicA-like mRNA interferase family)
VKLPRDISGIEFANALKRIGYSMSRQTGSHMRLSIDAPFQHHVTIPVHNPLKVGTLAAILDSVASAARMERSELLRKLFG